MTRRVRRPITRPFTESMARKKSDGIDETVTRRIAGRGSAARPGAKTAGRRSAAKKKTSATKARARKAAPNVVEDEGPPAPAGSTSLVIVESPAKAKTIGKYLGRGYRVKATVGHVARPAREEARHRHREGLRARVRHDRRQGKDARGPQERRARLASEVFLATDPDREGEAIAWHVAEQIKRRGGAAVRRVLFHEITKDAVQRAIASAGADRREEGRGPAGASRARSARRLQGEPDPLEDRQEGDLRRPRADGRASTHRRARARDPRVQAGGVLDHRGAAGEGRAALHGQAASRRRQEAGDREGSRRARSSRRWSASRRLSRASRRGTAGQAVRSRVTDVKRRERRKNPAPPFTTSTLQQEAAKKLGFGSKRTMRLAQDLYEGIDMGPRARWVSSPTCVPTPRAWPRARRCRRATICARCSAPSTSRRRRMFYGGGKNAQNTQDAHEGVRPTDPARRPELVRRYLKEDQFKLYQLIWQRFMASQMAPAVFDTTTVDYDLAQAAVAVKTTHAYLFRSTGSVIKFPGFLALYREAHEEGEHRALEDEQALPPLENGERVPVREIVPSQHFTEPPPRFSEASLVKELERLGIGRPSTYAQIISTLVDRHYTQLEQRRFFPTALGESVERVMVKQFPDIFNVGVHVGHGGRARQGRGGRDAVAPRARASSIGRSRSRSTPSRSRV